MNDLEKSEINFRVYLNALKLIRSKLNEIDSDLDRIEKEVNFLDLIDDLLQNEGVKDFIKFTLKVIEKKEEHLLAATFILGLQNISFLDYDRLISSFNLKPSYTKSEIGKADGIEIINSLCGEDLLKWQECLTLAQLALAHHVYLWNAITDLSIRKFYDLKLNKHSLTTSHSLSKKKENAKFDLTSIDTVKLYDSVVNNLMFNRLYFTSSIVNSIFIGGIDSFNRNRKGEISILTNREVVVIKYICNGYSNKEISELLELSKRTVDNHRQNILIKLKVKNTVGLVRFAIDNGLLKSGLINGAKVKWGA